MFNVKLYFVKLRQLSFVRTLKQVVVIIKVFKVKLAVCDQITLLGTEDDCQIQVLFSENNTTSSFSLIFLL